MPDTNNAPQKEVKLDDLLRLKRAEKPDAAFWNTFDHELHQRMLQALVKKDPWYVQLLRGVSGRIAQTAAVGAAAALLAMMVVRPAFVETSEPKAAAFAQSDVASAATESLIEVSMSELDSSITPDYEIEALTTASAVSDLGYTPDYSHDSFEVAAYDSDSYAMDTASFARAGLATGLVY